MGKQSKNNNVLSIEAMNQSNETNSKLDLNRMYLPESLITDKPQYKPKKSNYNEKENFSKKKQNYQANKFSEKINQYNDTYSF
jgi:pyocin large subunit-like protein